ncbi:MAG: hypothetical protein JRC92_06040 [Deltaproteobacteria bacterium]|nr:hypothetical protein [Deltaproteobacteria bacterium]
MSLHSTAQLLNLKKSLDTHLATALAGSGISIDWEGLVQNLSQDEEVVQPRLSLLGQERLGQGPEGLGQGLRFGLSLNIFVRAGETAGRLAEIRDLLAETFAPGRRVEFYDYTPPTPDLVDYLTIHRIVVDQGAPSKDGYIQHNLTVAGHLVQQWP